MRKLLISLIAVTLALGFLAPTTSAQGDVAYLAALQGQSVASIQTAEDTGDFAIIIKYVGSSANAQVEVNAGGDLLFTEDVGSGLAADASVLDTGGTEGTIDVSDTLADTLGEVVDIINAEADGNWVAAIHAGRRTLTSTDYLLVTAATSNVMRPEGLGIWWDSDVANTVNLVLSENQDGRDYFTSAGGLLVDPFQSKRAVMFWLRTNINFGTAGNLTIYSVDVENLLTGGSETVTEIYYQGAITDGSEAAIASFNNIGLSSRKGEKLLLEFVDTGTVAGVTLAIASGYEYEQ